MRNIFRKVGMRLSIKTLLWVPFAVLLIGLPLRAESEPPKEYGATALGSRVAQLIADRDRDWGRWDRDRDWDRRGWRRDRDWDDRRDRHRRYRNYDRRYYYPDYYRYQYRYQYPYRYNYRYYPNPYGRYYPYNYNYNSYYPQGGFGILGGLLRLF